MILTFREARRILAAVLGCAALASFLLPGPTSALASAAASPQAPRSNVEHPVADPGPTTPRPVFGRTSVAFGGGVYLAASITTRPGDGFSRIVQVTRVSTTGVVLDPVGIEVTDHVRGPAFRDPVVSFDGTNFLVTWLDERFVAAKRVRPDGVVLDAENIVVSTRTPLAERPAVAFDGDNYLVTWVSPSTPRGTSGDIFGRRVSPQGDVVDADDLTISADPADQHHVALAFNGTQYLLVWAHNGPAGATDIRETLVDTTGVAQNPAGTVISDTVGLQPSPAVTAVGPSFFVVWADAREASNHIYGSRVSAAGAVLDPDGIAISADAYSQGGPAVVSDGTSVLVTWVQDPSSNPRARFTLIDASGAVLDPTGRPLPAMWSELGVATDGTDYLVAGGHVAVRLSSSGDVLEPGRIVLSGTGNGQSEPDTAFDGTNSFVVWSDDRFGDQRIYGARVGADGQSIDGSGISISAPTELLDSKALRQTSPAVAFDGTNYLVVWAELRNFDGFPQPPQPSTQAARVSPSGQVLDRFPLDETGAGWNVDVEVAFGEGVFLVVWEAANQGPSGNIRSTRVSPAGVVLDPAPRPALNESGSDFAQAPSVAHGASGFEVVWQQDPFTRLTPDIYGTHVSAAGAVARPATVISAAADAQTTPDIAWHDGTYLVVWQDRRSGVRTQIYGSRLDGSGAVLDPSGIPISTDPAGEGAPTVAANGVFFVAWSRNRDGGRDIAGTTVSGSGAVGGSQFVARTDAPEDNANVSPISGARNFAVVYERFDAPLSADRAYLSYVSPK